MTEKSGADVDAPAVESRKSHRAPVRMIAQLFVSEGNRFKVEVHDLSPSGFRIQTPNSIAIGRLVYLTIPGLQSLQARVAWTHRESYGCEFTKPLHGSVCTNLSARFPSAFS